MSTLSVPAFARMVPLRQAPAAVSSARWYEDTWLLVTVSLAVLLSVTATVYAYQNHWLLLYADAHYHLQIARRVFDNIDPGLAQFGGVWLPLPHLLMEPFIWNDFLWGTGLAGAFASMPCYVLASVYTFLIGRRLTRDSRVSFLGALVFMVNPNILYMQSTPLSELPLIASLVMASFYFILWVQEDDPKILIWAAGATFLATLARYDGWALFITMLALIMIIGWQRKQSWLKIRAHLLLFGSLGGLGIVLWLLWCAAIFGSPFYFMGGPFSSSSQQQEYIRIGADQEYHNLFESVRSYVILLLNTMGPLLVAVGVVAVIVFLARRRLSPEAMATLTLLAPFAFYIVSFYIGQVSMFVPDATAATPNNPVPLYNARFGVVMVAPAAIYIATLLPRGLVAQLALSAALLVQTVVVAVGGVITLQEGQYGLACYHTPATVAYLAQHYDGGYILNDPFNNLQDDSSAGIPMEMYVNQGSGVFWNEALQNPATVVDWITIKPGDAIAGRIDVTSVAFQRQYTLVAQDPNGATLYRRNNLPPVPTRPLPPDMAQNYYAQCGTYGR